MLFIDRVDAGQRLAQALLQYKDEPVVVYGLARGGVVVAAEAASALGAPLDVLIPRKIGHPLQPEYGIGAVSGDGLLVMSGDTSVDSEWLEAEIERQRSEAQRMRELYMGGKDAVAVAGKTAIIMDDGIATGLTMKLAIKDLRRRDPARIVVAVPVIPGETYQWLREDADEVVALEVPEQFAGAVGSYYEDFSPVEDEEVVRIMGMSI
jgi:putative phosphoribosyl transferase